MQLKPLARIARCGWILEIGSGQNWYPLSSFGTQQMQHLQCLQNGQCDIHQVISLSYISLSYLSLYLSLISLSYFSLYLSLISLSLSLDQQFNGFDDPVAAELHRIEPIARSLDLSLLQCIVGSLFGLLVWGWVSIAKGRPVFRDVKHGGPPSCSTLSIVSVGLFHLAGGVLTNAGCEFLINFN